MDKIHFSLQVCPSLSEIPPPPHPHQIIVLCKLSLIKKQDEEDQFRPYPVNRPTGAKLVRRDFTVHFSHII